MAEIYGRSSKITRYYWREIWFETTRRFADWRVANGCVDSLVSSSEHSDVRDRIERQVVEEIRQQHGRCPKYCFREESQEQVLTSNRVEVVRLDGTYVKQTQRKVALLHGDKTYSAETFASLHYEQQGYRVLVTESVPFHTMFGIFLWLLIQDPADPLVRTVGFGDRGAAERREHGRTIWTSLPQDFGAPGYASRRAQSIDEHFRTMLSGNRDDLLWVFDYWVEPSEDLRQYLWAHRPENVVKAREIVSVLSPDVVRRVLRYLVTSYWQRFCGWPDLLAYRDSEFLFVEVKSSNDALSEDQKQWIRGNSAELHLPFQVVKIHRKRTIKAD